MLLTDPKLKALKPEHKKYRKSDGQGLLIEVLPSSTKRWLFRYVWQGQRCDIGLGTYPAVSLKKARAVREHYRELLADGIDPRTWREQKEREKFQIQNNRFEQVAEHWYKLREPTWAPSTRKKRRALLDNDLIPRLRSRPITEIETFELAQLLQEIAGRGALESAHNARQVLNQVLRFAVQSGLARHNPAAVLQGVLPPKQVEHHAAIVEPVEFGRLLSAIDNYRGSMVIRTMLQVAPLVFQRPVELAKMRWENINWEESLWIIPWQDKKEGKSNKMDHLAPLSRQAIDLLRTIHPYTGHLPYVFRGQRDHQNHANPESLNRALEKLGYKDRINSQKSHTKRREHSAHGFRASARTLLDEILHERVELIEAQLAHRVRDSLGRAYNRTTFLPERRVLMQRWADYLDHLKSSAS
ncbi:tyrosine-type recombinase/integrase [Microbulbifer hydrolyticus]|uniref:Integrase n=1 Tax=Microbulbifer hydrolyticus TaxID=48074 RepID=A0A6P1T7T6_9GAMM|nr:integrase arm-type DNA-binding domain-containing protein [Microbulbifer hydrolyticus]MBB5211462.1 integrase [Microbulbifer hydrolyticus]QHQ37785.1 integrase arm-type DNA-binding domain-containing protein [Microbulbifer hydrolyticus]